MAQNYYASLSADFSRPGRVSPEQGERLIQEAERFIALKADALPEITADYDRDTIERENKEWWPTHCEALRRGRGDLLRGE